MAPRRSWTTGHIDSGFAFAESAAKMQLTPAFVTAGRCEASGAFPVMPPFALPPVPPDKAGEEQATWRSDIIRQQRHSEQNRNTASVVNRRIRLTCQTLD